MEDLKATGSDELETDPIVKQIPVFHSSRLEKSLYVFQYPLRPKGSKNEMNIRKCCIKPQNEQVKLEMNVNMESNNIDENRARTMAKDTDGGVNDKEKDITFENNVVDKVLYASSKVIKECNNYVIAVYNGRELHVTSLKGLLQLRPDFSYTDRTSKRKRDKETSQESDEEEAGPSNAEQVTVKFKRSTGDIQKPDTSFRSLQKKCEQERWIPCDYFVANSTISELQRLKLFTENTMEDAGLSLEVSNSSYLKVLVPEDKEQSTIEPCLPSNVVSLHALRALPIQEQCKLLLKDAKIIQFNQLMMLLAGGEGLTTENLLKTLPKVAVLVQGNWIVKSEILYPTGTFSAVSGVPADLMCRARDYVLLLFKQNQYVERKKISSVISIPAEEIKEILTGIARLRHNKGWELTLPTDHDFISKHLDVVTRQNLMWEQRSKQVNDFFRDSKEKKQRRKSRSVSEECKGKGEIRDCSVSSDNDSGTEKATNKSPVVARKNKTVKVLNDSVSKGDRGKS